MPTQTASSLGTASTAELVGRFGGLLDRWEDVAARVQIQELAGPGPVVIDAAAHGGKRLRIGHSDAAQPIEVRLPADSPVGTIILLRQSSAAALRLVAEAGATIVHRLGHNGTAGQHAGALLTCETPGLWLLDGDTAVVA